jgi:hypothetical protein
VQTCAAKGAGGLANVFSSCSNRFSSINGYDPNAPSAYVQSYNLTMEHQLPKGMVVELGYTGSKGTHLSRQYDINQNNPKMAPCVPGGGGKINCRSYPFFSTINFFNFNAFSHYDAGTVTLRKRFEHGLLFRANFTYGKSMDIASGMNYGGAGGFRGAQDSSDPNAEYGRSDSDRKFLLNGNFVYALPFRHNFLTKGWQAAGSFQAGTGTPLTPQLNGPNADGGTATRPNRVCNGALAHPGVNAWFDTSCFPQVQQLQGVFGNSGRNILTGPKLTVINFSMSRNFLIADKQKLQFRWEIFNVPNHPNFNTPNDNVDEANAATITSAKDPRVMQLGAKYSF